MKQTTCPYAKSCHFFGIDVKSGHTESLLERYCFGEPRVCEIYQRRATHRTVSITLWPDGSLKARSKSPQSS